MLGGRTNMTSEVRASCGRVRLAPARPARTTLVTRAATYSAAETADVARKHKAEFSMLSSRLGGVVQSAVDAAVHYSRDRHGGRGPSAGVALAEAATPKAAAAAANPSPAAGPSPAGMASSTLRCLEAQLQARKFHSGGDEAGDVLAAFPSATLLHYPGGGLQGVVEEVAAAAADAHGHAAGSAAAAVLRSLAAAVGRLAAAPGAEAAGSKAAAVMTCLYGMAEALEGATATAVGAPGGAQGPRPEDVGLAMEERELLREAAAVLDAVADPGFQLSSRTSPDGHTVSASAPAHPLLAALETRLYADSTWRPASASHIAANLVDLVAQLLAPGGAGNTLANGGPAARGSACGALHAMARAQANLAAALRTHRAEPAAASRMLAALAEALAAAVITRDAADPRRGPLASTMFGEAALLLGVSRMAAGEAMGTEEVRGAQGPACARAAAADAAAGDTSEDPSVGDGDCSLVLEVLANQARGVAAAHRAHIAQVLQDLSDVPRSLSTLHDLTASLGAAAADAAAASVAASTLAAAGGAGAGVAGPRELRNRDRVRGRRHQFVD
ncbi:hypothetical protein HYH03_011979 [Edaphochlamys debaryana]|uniref:Uncharacterized protein n=1 Tax=Edaphochlamys debaryana TaxID=47281 RepID=A0A835XSP5_9CHLO|nr:hypothetical protein HYH03_011979 [Edaphochlamys debaryana]|eukprot:KAG2489528.1 hypothetical protein HYH03_011979 [Edaphochlamys debaryana]